MFTDIFGYLYRFSPVYGLWTVPITSGMAPSPRCAVGLAATPDGMVYLFGGASGDGE